MEESNVQPVRCPVTVCGDIHGQFVRISIIVVLGVNKTRWALDAVTHAHLIARFIRALSHRRQLTRHKLFIHGRLCGSRVLLCRNCYPPRCAEATVSWPHNNPKREPRESPDHTGVWILWWMLEEIWKRECVEILHRSVWFPSFNSFDR